MSDTVPLAYHEMKLSEQKEKYEERISVLEQMLRDLSGSTDVVEHVRAVRQPRPRSRRLESRNLASLVNSLIPTTGNPETGESDARS